MRFDRCSFAVILASAALLYLPGGCKKETTEDPFSKLSTQRREKAQKVKSAAKEEQKEKVAVDEKDTEKTKEKAPTGAKVVVEEEQVRGEGILAFDPLQPEVATMPTVSLSRAHEATCVVKVGDAMPMARLQDLQGRPQDLSKLMGDRLTVVVFWKANHARSVAELADLSRQVASSLAPQGVRVVAICEKDTAKSARAAIDKLGISFPVLLDADGKYFAQVATSKVPRTYLLDSSGKILWFDIDYSRPMRRDFREALRSLLAI